jgi:Na+/phosphate symporter
VIGANTGTTITVLLMVIGGALTKKRVSMSHLIFNLTTDVVAFAGPPTMVGVDTKVGSTATYICGFFFVLSFAASLMPRLGGV